MKLECLQSMLVVMLLVPAYGAVSAPLAAEPGAGRSSEPAFQSPPKPTAPLRIETSYDGEPAVGQPLVLHLTISSPVPAGQTILTLRSDRALVVLGQPREIELGSLQPGEPVEIDVTVLPLAGGTSHLHLTISAELRGRRQTRSLSVPIRLPEDAPRESADAEAGKSDSTVRSLRAVEEIR